jgi:hypothetical protein
MDRGTRERYIKFTGINFWLTWLFRTGPQTIQARSGII